MRKEYKRFGCPKHKFPGYPEWDMGRACYTDFETGFWTALPPSSPGAQARPASGMGRLPIAFGVPKVGSYQLPKDTPPSRPLGGGMASDP